MRDLTTQILRAANCPVEKVTYLLSYGSQVHGSTPPRDFDALLVGTGLQNAFVTGLVETEHGRLDLHLHVADESVVEDDITHDRYGWVFLTKYLDRFRLLHGDSGAAARCKAKAYLRLMGQWVTEKGIRVIQDPRVITDGIVLTLQSWNPQFEYYVEAGLIDPRRYHQYVSEELLNSPEINSLLHQTDEGFEIVNSSPFIHRADLRVVLARYWCYFMAYLLDPEDYLTDTVERVLRKKGMR